MNLPLTPGSYLLSDPVTLPDLIALRSEIAAFEAVRCRMAHERVKMDPQTGQPIPEAVPEQGYVRLGFCRKEDRAKRLACGHTMARYVLEKGIRAVPESARGDLETDLRETTNAIHSLDHKKGDAEKSLAHLAERKSLSATAENLHAEHAQALAAVRSVEAQHDDCVDRMGEIQRTLLDRLDALIATRQAGPMPAPAPAGVCH